MLVITPVVIGILLLLKFFLKTDLLFLSDVGSVSGYLTVIGTHYSILTAFIIFVVWDRFNKTSDAVDNEINNLSDIITYVEYMDDVDATADIKKTVSDYVRSVVDEEWKSLERGKVSPNSVKRFREIFHSIRSIKFDDSKDPIAWQAIIKKYEQVSDSRIERITLSTTRIPRVLKVLFYLVSFSVIVGFFLLGIENSIVAIGITAITTTVIVLVIEVVNDLDNPFSGKWAITAEPFRVLIQE